MFIQVCSLVYCKLILRLEIIVYLPVHILSIFLICLFLLGRINVKRLSKWMKENKAMIKTIETVITCIASILGNVEVAASLEKTTKILEKTTQQTAQQKGNRRKQNRRDTTHTKN